MRKIKKIVLFGSESTGKTTLAEKLAEHYKTVWVPEFAREYLNNEEILVTLDDVVPIAKGQILSEDQLILNANQFLICDTNILETKVYSESYFGKCPDWLFEEIETRQYDFYLLTNLDVEWIPDGVRDRPHMRVEMHQLFKNELVVRNLPFVEVVGKFDERIQNAIKAIDDFFIKKT